MPKTKKLKLAFTKNLQGKRAGFLFRGSKKWNTSYSLMDYVANETEDKVDDLYFWGFRSLVGTETIWKIKQEIKKNA